MTLQEGSSSDRVLAGRYRLGSRRGAGVDIAVFDAHDLGLGRAVVVKIVHPDLCAAPGFAERFRVTMQRVASIDHPNVGRVLDWGRSEWNGRPVEFVVTDVLAGGSVRDLIDRGRQLSASQTVIVGLDVCRGLDVAHRLGVVHGDIRPATLVFGADSTLRIIDLGLSRLVSEPLWADPSQVSLDQARYASPEQAAGSPAVAKSDIYSLCLTLIELLTGQVPFMGDSSVATLQNRLDKLMPVSADFGPLAAVFERAGRPLPDDRYSAAELGLALVSAAERLPRPASIPIPNAGLFADVAMSATAAPARAPGRTAARPDADPTIDLRRPTTAPEPVEQEASGSATPSEGAAPASATPVSSFDPPSDRLPVVPTSVMPINIPLVVSDGHVDADRIRAADAASVTDISSATDRGIVDPNDELDVGPDAVPDGDIAEPTDAHLTSIVPPPPRPDVPLLRERRSRRKLLAVIVIVLIAGGIGGAAAWWLGRDQQHTVPELSGMQTAEALNQISEFGWVTTVAQEPSDDVAAGLVIRTVPAVGDKLSSGGSFTIVASNGPAPRALPEVTGMTVDQATAALAALQLQLQLGDQANSETVPTGVILSWSIPDQPGLVAGDTVVRGTTVVVVVSAGPAPRIVPDLTGMTLDQATAAIQALGLVVAPLPDEFSDTVAAGLVVRQEPAPGNATAPGGTVNVVLSKGQDLVVVPPLAALTVQQANDALTAAGLVLQVVGDPTGVAILAEVGGQSIGADISLPRGTTIDVTFEVPPPPTTLPPETTLPPDTTVDPAATTTTVAPG